MFAARLAVALTIASGAAATPPQRVVFVGNSLTSWNDLPGLVGALADSAGAGPLEVQSVTAPDVSLADHLDRGAAAAAIQRGRPDVVILQQGPSSLDASRADLIAASERFAALIAPDGGRPALYGVWPDRTRLAAFDRVSESYRLAAEHVAGIYLPAGEAWRAAWRRDATLALYDADGFHPSVLGTYTAALVIYQRLTGRSPLGLPARLRTRGGVAIEIAPAVARLLQEAAAETNARFPS